jgi:hypothetical protein
MKTYLKQALACIALVCLLLVVIITPVAAPATTPATTSLVTDTISYNGMSIQYTISGVNVSLTRDYTMVAGGVWLGPSAPTPDATVRERGMEGTINPGVKTLRVAGTVSMQSGHSADVNVSFGNLEVGLTEDIYKSFTIPAGGSSPFSLYYPVPNYDTRVFFGITMIGHYDPTPEAPDGIYYLGVGRGLTSSLSAVSQY